MDGREELLQLLVMNHYFRSGFSGCLLGMVSIFGCDRAFSELELFAFENGLGFDTFSEEAEFLKAEGYSGVSQVGGKPERVAMQAETYGKAGLRVLSIYLDAASPDLAEGESKEFMANLKGKVEMIELTVKAMKPETIVDVRRISNEAAETGLKVVLYPHHGYAVATMPRAMDLIAKVNDPNLGVMFNLCHFLRGEDVADLEKVIADAGEKLCAVSISGADADGRDWGALIKPLDRGDFPMERLLKALKKADFDGPIALQCYGVSGDKRKNLERSMAAWRTLTE